MINQMFMKNRHYRTGAILAVALLTMTIAVARTGRMGRAVMMPTDSVVPSAEDAKKSIIDEVIWVVGDEAILKSDVEALRLQGEAEGMKWDSNPDAKLVEQLAIQKLFLHQAALDSIEVTESEIAEGVEERINYWISLPQIGTRERLEAYQKKSIAQMRLDMHDEYKNQMLTQRMQQKLVEDIKITPAEVRAYFKDMPADSLPLIPTMVEVEIITMAPRVEQEEINRVKNELRDYTERVTNGTTSFATLARMYSEDPGSARQGGELGYMGRGVLDPTFAGVAFNLTDPKKISKIVETEFGYHIIQLIDRRGDRINVRHILLKPKISADAVAKTEARLDSVANDIRAGKFTFEAAASVISDDKDTKNNNGLMANSLNNVRTSRFAMRQLPTEVARVVDTLQVNQVSAPFIMVNSKGKMVCAIVKLKSRIDEHRATISEDFQALKDVVLNHRREQILNEWIGKKIKETYVRMLPRYREYKYEYDGWVK
jgi:peptidyl-prolyl cis-trans isomerase SurA